MPFKKSSLAAMALMLVAALPAFALELGDAKSNGLVGETSSGYLAAVKPSPQVDTLVSDINNKRKSHYQKIADKNGISLQAVEVRAGQKAIQKTAPGEFIDSGAGWEEK